MSAVTNIILKTGLNEHKGIAELNAKFFQSKPFISCDDDSLGHGWYAGSKCLECEIYVGAFNHLVISDLVSAIRTVNWDDRPGVQLFAQGPEGHWMKEIEL